MEIEKGKTYKYLKEMREIPESVKENLKNYTRIKRTILDVLKEGDMTVGQISEKTGLPRHDVLYYLMTLAKYGFVQTGGIDDMDEYFYYKIKA